MKRVSNAKQRLMEAVLELSWSGSYGSTTIDRICEKAGVKKGSFYYFFASKAELTVAALDAHWQAKRRELDSIFSPTVSPLKRLHEFWHCACRQQAEEKDRSGRTLGCFVISLGAEISTQEDGVRQKVEEILDDVQKYLESAIRDAHAAGLIPATNPAAKARMLLACYEGLLTEARIRNNADVLRQGVTATEELLRT